MMFIFDRTNGWNLMKNYFETVWSGLEMRCHFLCPPCQDWAYGLWSEGPKMEDCDRGLNYKLYPLTLIYFLFVSSCSSIQSRISFIFFTLQKDVILVDLTVWIGRKEYIENKWKLKDWNGKKENLRTELKICQS